MTTSPALSRSEEGLRPEMIPHTLPGAIMHKQSIALQGSLLRQSQTQRPWVSLSKEEQVSGGEKEEKQKQKNVGTMKRQN